MKVQGHTIIHILIVLGLISNWKYVYTINHTVAPVVPADGGSTVECIASATTPVPPTVTDVCGTNVPAVLASTVDSPLTLICEGTRTYNYTYTDCSGLVSNWKYVYTIERTTAPSEFGGPVGTFSTVGTLAAAVAPSTLPVVMDVCGNTLDAPVPIVSTSVTCGGSRTYTYTYVDCSASV